MRTARQGAFRHAGTDLPVVDSLQLVGLEDMVETMTPKFTTFLATIGVLCMAWLYSSPGEARIMVRPPDQNLIILPLDYAGGDKDLAALGQGMSDLLMSSLGAYKGIAVIERENLHKVIKELGATAAGFGINKAPELGRLLQANRLVKGSFLINGNEFHVNIGVYDVQTTQLVASVEESGPLGEVAKVAERASERIAHALLNGDRTLRKLPVDETPEVNLHFMKGLGHFFSGLHDHAVADFMQALDLDPAHADSRYWLVKSYIAGGSHDHAKIEFKRFAGDFPGDERIAKLKATFKNRE